MQESEILLNLQIFETGADDERLDLLTSKLIRNLRGFDIEHIGRKQSEQTQPKGSRGEPITFGAIVLVVLPAVLPSLISFIQSWLEERRKIIVEAPNGAKVEFTPNKKYSEDDIILLIKRLSKITESN